MQHLSISSPAKLAIGVSGIGMGQEALNALYDMRWMLVFAVVLIVADFRYGVMVSHKKGETVRFSKAWRRTCNKFVDYFTYMLVGVVLGLAILEPMGIATHTTAAAIGIGAGSLFEMQSIISHVLYIHGVDTEFSVWKFIKSLIRRKSADIGEAIDEATNNHE